MYIHNAGIERETTPYKVLFSRLKGVGFRERERTTLTNLIPKHEEYY